MLDLQEITDNKGCGEEDRRAEALGQEDMVTEEDLADARNPVDEPSSDWCCLYQVLSLQDDFTNEKPMI